MSDISRGSIKVQGFSDPEMDFQLLRQLGSSAYRGASIGECFHTVSQMQNSSPQQWVKHFEQMAEWQKSDGLERLVKNHVISGRDQLLKACNSYRAAEYYSTCGTEQQSSLGLNSADCFSTALSSMDLHFENHSLHYKNIEIPAYFISPANDGKKRQTVMIVSGFDGTLEEEFIMRGLAAVERGYNVIHFAGPGQMDVFRHYPQTSFEPDFEQVVKRVINHFEYRTEVDMRSLALMGISFGGYFATRASVHEPRIKRLIVNSPIVDLHAYLCAFVTMDPCTMPDDQDFGIQDLPNIPEETMSPTRKFLTEQLITRFGLSTFKQTFNYLKEFSVPLDELHTKTPSLALIGEGEGQEPKRQFAEFCQRTDSEYCEFSNAQGAGNHCQVGNVTYANAVMYDWLESV